MLDEFAGNAELDGAILDVYLAGRNSYAVAETLRQRGVPFAFTSGKGAKDIEPRFFSRPIFTKPVDESKLKKFIEQHIQT